MKHVKEEESLEEYKQRIASAGGVAVVRKYGKKHMQKIHKSGLESRWGKKKKSKLKKLLFE